MNRRHSGIRQWRVQSLVVGLVVAFGSAAVGQVYQWEFVDPTNPSLGKRQSTTLAPGGATARFDTALGLFGLDLTKAYLFRASLPMFRVRTTILDDAYLAEADLYNLQGDSLTARGTDFSRANLEIARLEQAKLTDALFVDANLKHAYMSHAELAGTNFSGADILEAQLAGTTDKGFTAQQLYQTASYQQGMLNGVRLSSNDLSGWNFAGQRLDNASFGASILTGASFRDAVITNADLTQTNLAPAQLYETKSYKDKQVDGVLFDNMNVEGWDFSDQSLVRSSFRSTQLSGAIFDRANLTFISIGGQEFVVQRDVSFRGADLTFARFDVQAYGRWERADFTGATLVDADLSSSGFVDSNFTDAIIRGADLGGVFEGGFTLDNLYSTASYKSGDLTGIVVSAGDLRGAVFTEVDLSGAHLSNVDLAGANFRKANLTGGFLSGVTLDGADFLEASLTNANIRYQNTSSVSFRGADLTGAGFEHTSLIGADFTDAIVFGTRLTVEISPQDLKAEQLYSTASYKMGLLGPITLTGNMQGWNFQGQDLSGALFGRGSHLTDATWNGAILQDTEFYVNTLPGTDFRDADVRKVRFSASTLDGSDFRQTDLSEARFSESSLVGVRFDGIRAPGARFIRDNLQGASFVDADLRDAEFISIDSFVDADFSGADIRGADFAHAMEGGFTLEQLRSTRSFQQRDLSGVVFEGNDFAGIDLSNFRFVGADFNQANLAGANFSGADATGVSFRNADLAGLNLTDAIVKRANFTNSDRYGFNRDMLESTASYKNRVLTGINLSQLDLRNWDFRGQDLREASFESSHLGGADLELSDLRGARLPAILTDVELGRSILPDGRLPTLQIADGETLIIRAAPIVTPPSADPPGIMVGSAESTIDGVLEVLFDGNEWQSTLKFNVLDLVTINGDLKLAFEDFATPAAAVGKSFDLFDWSLVEPIGQFRVITDPNHVWDLSALYTTGAVQLVAVVPEPSSWAMVVTVLMYATALRRRRHAAGGGLFTSAPHVRRPE